MKLNLRKALPLLMAVALFYSACKKTDNKPAAASNTTDAIGAAIAKNLVKSLSGAYGGASIKDGVGISPAITAASPKLKTQTIGCGFYKDNSLDVTFNQGDTIKSHTVGTVNYFFYCHNQRTTGFDLYDSLSTTGSGPGYDFFYAIVQDFKIRGLNVNNSNFTLNGHLKSFIDYDYKLDPKSSSSVHNDFRFIACEVHADDNFDIVSGDALFSSDGLTNTGAWHYSGTIKFLGNHKAKMTFLSKVYLIDLLTGSVTPV